MVHPLHHTAACGGAGGSPHPPPTTLPLSAHPRKSSGCCGPCAGGGTGAACSAPRGGASQTVRRPRGTVWALTHGRPPPQQPRFDWEHWCGLTRRRSQRGAAGTPATELYTHPTHTRHATIHSRPRPGHTQVAKPIHCRPSMLTSVARSIRQSTCGHGLWARAARAGVVGGGACSPPAPPQSDTRHATRDWRAPALPRCP